MLDSEYKLKPYLGSSVDISIQQRIKETIIKNLGESKETLDIKWAIEGKKETLYEDVYIFLNKIEGERRIFDGGPKFGPIDMGDKFCDTDSLRVKLLITKNGEIFMTILYLSTIEGRPDNEFSGKEAIFDEKGNQILPWGDYSRLRRYFYRVGKDHYAINFGRGEQFDTKKGFGCLYLDFSEFERLGEF